MSKYHDLVSRFITQLELGTRPWARSWTVANDGRYMRPLRHNGAPYRGVNTLALWCAAEDRGFSSPHWMTFNQAKEFGADVRKGAKAAHVFYYGTIARENDQGEASIAKFVKTYCVFNAEEIEGLPERYRPVPPPITPAETEARNIAADDFTRRAGAAINHGGGRAFYNRAGDFIQMPHFETFHGAEAYYATLLHELTHWTGAPGRVERPKGQRFGDAAYAMEELVAELGAAFLCSDLRLSDTPREDHASYLANWANALKAQPSILMSAASAAEKACDYLHALQAHQAAAAPLLLAAE
jgi:antirestriction protein ArdC